MTDDSEIKAADTRFSTLSLDDTICTEPCDEHPSMTIKYFCQVHQSLICEECTTCIHKKCTVDYIPLLAQGYKDCKEYKDLNDHLALLTNQMKMCSKRIESCLNEKDNVYTSELCALRKYREEIKVYFDKREAEIIAKMKEIKDNDETRLKRSKKRCKEILVEIEAMKMKMKMTERRSKSLFLLSKKALQDLTHVMADLNDINRNSTVHRYAFSKDPYTERLLESGNYLGGLDLKEDLENNLSEMPTGELEVEVAASRLKPDIIAKCDTDTNDCWFTSIKLFSKDKILLADNANFAVKLIDIETHILVDNLRVPEQPWDICLLPSHKAAVSFPTTIQLIGTECELSLLRSIKVKGECYGIDFYNDTFIVSSEEPARIEIINMKGLVLSQIETNALGQHIFKNPHYLTVVSNVQETAIFVSDSGTNNITKLSLNLNVLKTFTTVRQLTEPRGIGLMKGNDLLVCGRGSNSIFQLDTLNDILIEIVGHDEKLQRPFTACYCPRRKKVIYSCYKLFENELNGCVKIL